MLAAQPLNIYDHAAVGTWYMGQKAVIPGHWHPKPVHAWLAKTTKTAVDIQRVVVGDLTALVQR